MSVGDSYKVISSLCRTNQFTYYMDTLAYLLLHAAINDPIMHRARVVAFSTESETIVITDSLRVKLSTWENEHYLCSICFTDSACMPKLYIYFIENILQRLGAPDVSRDRELKN